MKKDVFWRSGGVSCLWSPEYGFLYYHPEHDRDRLHELYGGKNYYISLTGKTGAGYLNPSPKDLLVEFGFYCVDRGHGPGNQQKMTVGNSGEAAIFGYCPIVTQGLPKWKKYPIVLTDGQKITFVHPDYVSETIREWDNLSWDKAIEIKVDYIKADFVCFAKKELEFKLLTNYFRGVNALRFADLRKAQQEAKELIRVIKDGNYNAQNLWEQNLNVYYDGYSRVFVYDLMRIVKDVIFIKDEQWPVEINGWAVERNDSKIFCYRQNRTDVEAFVSDLDANISYENIYSIYEFNAEVIKQELFDKLNARLAK